MEPDRLPDRLVLTGAAGAWSLELDSREQSGEDERSTIDAALGEGAFEHFHLTEHVFEAGGREVKVYTPRRDGRPGLDGL